MTVVFSVGSYTKNIEYKFYVLPKADLSDEQLPLSNEWFNTLNDDQAVGIIYDGSLEHHIFIDLDYLSASRLYREELIPYSSADTVTQNITYSISWASTTGLNASLETSFSASANSYFVAFESTSTTQIGASLEIQNSWTKGETSTFIFNNHRYYYDSEGDLYYIHMRIVQYKLYVPLRVETYKEVQIPMFTQPYKFLSKTSYIISPIKTGIIRQWNDGRIEDWRSSQSGTITLNEFYGDFAPAPGSISMIF